jgi:hypothetical protein
MNKRKLYKFACGLMVVAAALIPITGIILCSPNIRDIRYGILFATCVIMFIVILILELIIIADSFFDENNS